MPPATADLARDLLDLVLPVTCAGCGAPGRALCPACLHRWSGPPRRCEHAAGRLDRMDGSTLPVWALAANDGPVRRAVVAWKDGGRADLTPWLAAVVARAAPAVLRSLDPGRLDPEPLLVVPAPPSPRGRARRGEDLVGALAVACAGAVRAGATAGARGVPAGGAGRASAVACAGAVRAGATAGAGGVPAGGAGRAPAPGAERASPAGAGVQVAPAAAVLRLARGGRDQVGLGVRGRAANLAGRVRLRRGGAAAVAGARVLLVDDVLTTGATLAACRTTLEHAGALVAGALVLAVTRPPGSPTAWLEASANPG